MDTARRVHKGVRWRRAAASVRLTAMAAFLVFAVAVLAEAQAAVDAGAAASAKEKGLSSRGGAGDAAARTLLAADDAPTPEKVREAVRREWQEHYHHLQALSVRGLSITEVLGPIWDHDFEMPPAQMLRSLVYSGPNARLRRVVRRLIAGDETVRVAALGGSITVGSVTSDSTIYGWFPRLQAYMHKAFPRAKMEFRNAAVPAAPSIITELCLERFLPGAVDLVFVEFVVNDGAPGRCESDRPLAYERLLRKVMRLPGAPAVVLVQMPALGMLTRKAEWKTHFGRTYEDVYGAAAQLYDTPWLSFRNAMWRVSEDPPPRHSGAFPLSFYMWVDFIHPNDFGHKVVADMAVFLLQSTAISLATRPHSAADVALTEDPLPKMLYPDNVEGDNLLCSYGRSLTALVDAGQTHGFELVNEGRGGSEKWGFMAEEAGAQLVLVVDTTAPAGSGPPAGNVSLYLAFLKSYERMGVARVECISDCVCTSLDVDAHHTERHSSLNVQQVLVSQAARCSVRVTVLPTTSSGEHKFRVSGVMGNAYSGFVETMKIVGGSDRFLNPTP